MEIRSMQYVFRKNIKKIYYTVLTFEDKVSAVSPVDNSAVQYHSSTLFVRTDLVLCPLQANDRVLLDDGRTVEVLSIYADSKSTNWANIRNLNSTIPITIELNLLLNNLKEFIK